MDGCSIVGEPAILLYVVDNFCKAWEQGADRQKGSTRLAAFLGGLDLCSGRYDTAAHPLFRTLHTTHSNDFRNRFMPGATVQKGGVARLDM